MGIYYLQYLTRGMAYVIIPPILWKVSNILPYLYKIIFRQNQQILVSQAQRTVFFYPSPASLHLKVFTKLHDSSCKNNKIFQLLRGEHPSDTPCAHKHTTKSPSPPKKKISKMDLCPWMWHPYLVCIKEIGESKESPQNVSNMIKGWLHPNQNWACFVRYLKVINTFF